MPVVRQPLRVWARALTVLLASPAAAPAGAGTPVDPALGQVPRLAALSPDLRLAFSATSMALATPAPYRAAGQGGTQSLWLEVVVNGERQADMVSAHLQDDAQGTAGLSISQAGWQAMGLTADAAELADGYVVLSQLKDVTADFDAAAQRLTLTVPVGRFRAHVLDAFGQAARLPDAAPLSAVINYDLFAQHTRPPFASGDSTALSGLFEGRLTGGWGGLFQSLVADTGLVGDRAEVRRLDSSYRYHDPVAMTSWQVGDAVSAGLASRSAIRFAGVQWRRNFSLRPDLVTFPTPSFTGSSAVPTSVDLYVDQMQRGQIEVPAGPFTLNQLPVLTGPNQVQVVVRDALGREQLTTMDMFASPQLLRPGLSDFAVQTGFARRGYASDDDRYDRDLFAIASTRYGLSSTVTLEGQGEYARDVSLLGFGVASLIGGNGSFGLNAAGSRLRDGATGGELSGRFDYWFGRRLIINGAFSEATSDFRDVASVTGGWIMRSRQQLAISQSFNNGSTLAMSWLRQRGQDDSRFSSLMVTAARNVMANGYISLSGWRSLEDDDSWGASLGLNWFLGDRRSASAYYDVNEDGDTAVLRARSSLPTDPGWGWGVEAAEGQREYRRAELLNRNRYSDVIASVEDGRYGQSARLGMTGALAWMPGAVQAGRRINDAWALVDLGYADIPVFLENRPVGRTDDKGFLLVNDLSAYMENKLSLEAMELPLDVFVRDADHRVMPERDAGLRVRFDVSRNSDTLLALKLADGGSLSLGSRIVLPDGEQRVVGHEGLVLVPADLAGRTLTVLMGSTRCELPLPAGLTADQQHAMVLEPTCP